ncbi:MAG: PQQ-dependent sugar dehydrogenase, partial [Fimbriimonadaceae bacterium]
MSNIAPNAMVIVGKAGGAGTQSLLTKAKFHQDLDRKFYDAIKLGVADAGMEAFGQTLTDKEVWAQVVHIRELQRDGLRAETAPKITDGVYDGERHDYTVETVVEGNGLRVPWAIDWLPDGKMLITNRPGKMAIFASGAVTWVEGLPPSVEIGQGGLMEVAVHPEYAKNGWIYLAFTDPGENGRSGMTMIVRGKLNGSNWTSTQTIFENEKSTYNSSGVHFGSRIVFDGKGHIYFSIGERGNGNLAQDLTKPNGKIYRVNEDGTIPKDNPFVGKGGIDAVWSYGHRNPQGLAIDLDGNIWDTEHGPRGGDEVNLI